MAKVTNKLANAGKARKVAKADKATKAATVKASGKVAPKAKAGKVSKATKGNATPQVKYGSGVAVPADSARITFVAENYKRGASAERYAKYRKGMTIGAALATKGGPTRADIKYDLGRGNIKVAGK